MFLNSSISIFDMQYVIFPDLWVTGKKQNSPLRVSLATIPKLVKDSEMNQYPAKYQKEKKVSKMSQSPEAGVKTKLNTDTADVIFKWATISSS